jgi:hypothetical protein
MILQGLTGEVSLLGVFKEIVTCHFNDCGVSLFATHRVEIEILEEYVPS